MGLTAASGFLTSLVAGANALAGLVDAHTNLAPWSIESGDRM
jgi:hypothetical protein